jgi:hypothetical protein
MSGVQWHSDQSINEHKTKYAVPREYFFSGARFFALSTMFSTLLRQQTQLASSARLSSPLTRQFLRGLPQSVQKPHILSQRAFSFSRSLSEGDRFRENSGRNSFRDRPFPRRRPPPGPVIPQSTLHAGNLPFSATEDEVREMFESYGQIKRIRLGTTSLYSNDISA